MKIKYQGELIETSAENLAAFLDERGGAAANAIVEYRGEVIDAGALDTTPIEDGAELNVYRIVSGG